MRRNWLFEMFDLFNDPAGYEQRRVDRSWGSIKMTVIILIIVFIYFQFST